MFFCYDNHMDLIDIHCHLYSIPNVEEEVQRARDAGVSRVLVVSEDLDTMEKTLRIRDRFPDFVLPGLGIHPANATLMSPAEWERNLYFLREHAQEATVIGEVGLDYKYAETEEKKKRQQGILEEQMEIAREHGLPLNLHSRRALRQTMEAAIAFRKDSNLPVLLHWFAHSKKLLRRTNEEGIFVSAGPSILISEDALAIACHIAAELILVETDTPVPYNGESSRPFWSRRVADTLIDAWPEGSLSFATLKSNAARYLRE